jgi:hypothetical protein
MLDRSDQPFGNTILQGRGRCGRPAPDAHAAQSHCPVVIGRPKVKGIRYRAPPDFNWDKKQRATFDEKKGHAGARWSRPLRVQVAGWRSTGRRATTDPWPCPAATLVGVEFRREPLQPSIPFHLAGVPFFSPGRAIIRDAGRRPWKNSQSWTRWSRC